MAACQYFDAVLRVGVLRPEYHPGRFVEAAAQRIAVLARGGVVAVDHSDATQEIERARINEAVKRAAQAGKHHHRFFGECPLDSAGDGAVGQRCPMESLRPFAQISGVGDGPVLRVQDVHVGAVLGLRQPHYEQFALVVAQMDLGRAHPFGGFASGRPLRSHHDYRIGHRPVRRLRAARKGPHLEAQIAQAILQHRPKGRFLLQQLRIV